MSKKNSAKKDKAPAKARGAEELQELTGKAKKAYEEVVRIEAAYNEKRPELLKQIQAELEGSSFLDPETGAALTLQDRGGRLYLKTRNPFNRTARKKKASKKAKKEGK
jgi:hypothetical protein